jgi:hypothetical protein
MDLSIATGLIDTSPNVVVVVRDPIDDREISVLRHLDRPQTHLVAKPDPRGLSVSHTALNKSTVSPQESQGREKSVTCLFEVNEEDAMKETIDTRMTIHHRILTIVIYMFKDDPNVDIQTSLGKPVGLKTGIPIQNILPVVMGSQCRQLLGQGQEEGVGGRNTRILNQTWRTIVTRLELQEQELRPLPVGDVHALKEKIDVDETTHSLQVVVVRQLPRKLAAPHLDVAALCRLLPRTRLHGGRTLWCRLARVLLSLLVPKQR